MLLSRGNLGSMSFPAFPALLSLVELGSKASGTEKCPPLPAKGTVCHPLPRVLGLVALAHKGL